MRFLVGLAMAGGLALGATPVLAFTILPFSMSANARQFADPDAALDGFASSARDGALAGGAYGQTGPWANGAANFDGLSSRDDGDTQAVGIERSGAAVSRGLAPSLNSADLYDGEPPFMPTVVGQHQP